MHEHRGLTAVIVDEQPLRLEGIEALLRRLDVLVVARATTADEARQCVDDHHPDVLVTDYSLAGTESGGDESGADMTLSLLNRAREVNAEVKCIVLSDKDDLSERERAFGSGAAAYCIKRTAPDDLAVAVRQAFSPSIYLANSGVRLTASIETPERAGASILTKREAEILRLAAEGYSNSELAKMLWVTEPTVKFHLSNIYRKLNVANRTEASRWAQRHGLLTNPASPAPAAA
jgi:DNA-binding NarL/FixJ family response regulator